MTDYDLTVVPVLDDQEHPIGVAPWTTSSNCSYHRPGVDSGSSAGLRAGFFPVRTNPLDVSDVPKEPTNDPRHVIIGEDGSQAHFRREKVEELLAKGEFFWLDLDRPDPDDFEILRDVFKFHQLALEDSENFGQRAKLDEYDDYVFLVVYGANPDEDRLVEVHCFYSPHYLVTVHRDDCPAFREIRERYAKRAKPIERPIAPPLPDRRRSRRQLLPHPGRLRQPDRRARECDLSTPRR